MYTSMQSLLYILDIRYYIYQTYVTIYTRRTLLYILDIRYYIYQTYLTIYTRHTLLYILDKRYYIYQTYVTIYTKRTLLYILDVQLCNDIIISHDRFSIDQLQIRLNTSRAQRKTVVTHFLKNVQVEGKTFHISKLCNITIL